MSWNTSIVATGLSTVSANAQAAGPAFIKGKIQVPTLVNGGGQSSVVATVTQTPVGGSTTTIYTGTAGAEGFYVVTNCAVSDLLSITFSSSASADQALNVIKSEISIGSGQ